MVNRERCGVEGPMFRLRAVVNYYDDYYKEYGSEEFTADFAPMMEEWQYASVQFAKSAFRKVKDVQVFCDYSYNNGTVYFDDIQLVRDSLEKGLSASDFVTESSGDAEDDTEETTETTGDSAPEFAEAEDAYGNALTETTFTDGEFGSIYRSFGFNADSGSGNAGNDLIRETDERGYETTYTVDEETSRNEEVTDRLGNQTAYVYDTAGRTRKVTSKDAGGTELANVSYTYDNFDNLTEIVRGDGMKYVLAYNTFHNLASIGVDGKAEKLVSYTYKNGNGRLKEVAYANGDVMKATYNRMGQMNAEKWYDVNENLTAHYKYVYDGEGNIVRSIDILNAKEYDYHYEDGKIIRATECDITVNESEMVTAKTLVHTVLYSYDAEDKLTKKRILPADGTEQVIYYEQPDDAGEVVKFTAGGRTVTSHSKTDSFGRKVFDELQLGTGFVSRQFHYHAGQITEEHKENAKLKSTATTQLVSRIVLSDGRTLAYEYDAEERITKVIDSVDGTTTYTYDALGQLLMETRDGVSVNTMTYDNYGNILTKNGVTYSYGDAAWKDKLTAVGGQSITYDAQGNPTCYLGHTLSWEKGRQLKSFDNIQYTYNANGIRTSKTVNGVKHTYLLDGTKILRETWGEHTLLPLYDNEESVCGIVYNDVPYYFLKNQQGDVIALTDKDAQVVAKYRYDAWGVCTVAEDTTECGIASINPYRYRGYYYDSEIGLYYVSSRYYDPEIGRWLNSDDAQFVNFSEALLSLNLFCYCHNSPVNNVDENGQWLARVIGAVAVGAIFARLAYVVLKVVNAILKSVGCAPLSKKVTALITAGIGALGAVIGAIFGPAFLAKHSPRLLKAINQIEKQKFSIKKIKPNSGGNLFGINISNSLMLMLHYPHAGKDEWNFHFQAEWRTPAGKNLLITKKKIFEVSEAQWQKWRKYFGNK